MTDRRYKIGSPREQGLLLPPHVEDYVSDTNPVRAIDAYVDTLDLEELGFTNSQGGLSKGQPSYDPADMLRIYLYGYLNRVQSSRNLEKETHRNLEVIWLIRGLRPTYKTISDFRKDNLSALKAVNSDFVLTCKDLQLFGCELVGIDGSFFNGNASKGSIQTKGKIKKQLAKIELDIAKYLEEIEASDRGAEVQSLEDADLEKKLAKLNMRQKSYLEKLNDLEASGQTQLSSTDPDARLLSKQGQNTAGYNVQYAVDDKHKLLAVCDVVNDGNDSHQLLPMSQKAKTALGVEELEVAADCGYYNQAHLKDCQDEGITPYVAIPDYSGAARKDGRYGRQDFRFDKDRNVYKCPAGHYLKQCSRYARGGKFINKYANKASICGQCSLREKCLPKKTPYRQVSRYEHEAAMEAHQKRMEQKGREYMKKRASLAEHPFGTLKLWLGWTHFSMRGLDKVRAEMDLLMLSYNFKRVLNIIGVKGFQEYCRLKRQYYEPFNAISQGMISGNSLMKRINRNELFKLLELRIFAY